MPKVTFEGYLKAHDITGVETLNSYDNYKGLTLIRWDGGFAYIHKNDLLNALKVSGIVFRKIKKISRTHLILREKHS